VDAGEFFLLCHIYHKELMEFAPKSFEKYNLQRIGDTQEAQWIDYPMLFSKFEI
jgi:hypothetical protein